MRFAILIFIFILLADYATAKPNYYTKTINSWKGADARLIIKHWGRPDKILVSDNGNSTMIYEVKSYPFTTGPASPQIGVSPRAGGAIITTTPSTNYSWTRGMNSATCITVFEVNSKGKIIGTQSKGFCYGDENFIRRRGNPEQ